MSTPEATTQRIRWGLIVLVAVAGTALIALAFRVPNGSGWQGIAASVLVNLGTTVFLAGVLFLIERRFTRVVVASQRHVEARVEQRVEELTRPLTTRLADLEGQMRDELSRETSEQDRAVSAVLDDVSFDSLKNAFGAVNALNATSNNAVTVQGGDNCYITFQCGKHLQMAPRGVPVGQVIITMGAELAKQQRIELAWLEGQTADEVGIEFIRRITAQGGWEGSRTLDWPNALRRLQRALDIALRSRRRDLYAWHLTQPLVELVDDRWALTEAGIESRDGGLLVGEDAFMPKLETNSENVCEAPPRPDNAEQFEWDHVVARARRHYPRQSWSAALAAMARMQWQPYVPQ